MSAQIGVDLEATDQREQLAAAVAALEWARRQLAASSHPGGMFVRSLLDAVADRPNAPEVLGHPWTLDWIEVLLLLIDRDAPRRLPDGQLAAHLGAAKNILAALWLGDRPIEVRFDQDGVAWLPGTGFVAVTDRAAAGLTGTLSPFVERLGGGAHSWPKPGDVNDDVDVRLRDAPAYQGVVRLDRTTTTRVDAAPAAVTALSTDLVGRWQKTRGAVAGQPNSGPIAAPDPCLLALMTELGIPAPDEPNTLARNRIRLDASFDRLSLLSVRSPAEFERLAEVASHGTDRVARRIQAHVAYIERRHLEAAEQYASLLSDQPDDVDLWRDVCWALRHAGQEGLVRVWVLHPAEVVHVASMVDWQRDDRPDHNDANALDLLRAYLEWISDALCAR